MSVEDNLREVLEKIAELEDEYGVSIHARGGSYGGARLVVIDSETDFEMTRD